MTRKIPRLVVAQANPSKKPLRFDINEVCHDRDRRKGFGGQVGPFRTDLVEAQVLNEKRMLGVFFFATKSFNYDLAHPCRDLLAAPAFLTFKSKVRLVAFYPEGQIANGGHRKWKLLGKRAVQQACDLHG
jgi:hypothetical protein